MYQGTTPTFTLTVPATVDLTTTSNVYVTFSQGNKELTKTGSSIVVSAQSVDVYLTQEETLMFLPGTVRIQLNWTFSGGQRACSNIRTILVDANLITEVLE